MILPRQIHVFLLKYLEKKNMYLSWQDHNHPSFVVYVEAVNEVYNRYFNRGGGYSVQSIF